MSYKVRCLRFLIKHDVSYALYSTMYQTSYKARLKCPKKHDVSNVIKSTMS